MREKHYLYFAYSLFVGGLCFALADGLPPFIVTVPLGLVAACLLGLNLIISLAGKALWINSLIAVVVLVGAAVFFGSSMLPLAAVIIVQIAENIVPGFYRACLVSSLTILIILVVFAPGLILVLFSALSAGGMMLSLAYLTKLKSCRTYLEQQREENKQLRDQIAGQRRMVQTMEVSARINERNRLAARIHDQIGHGVSGSILLLDGAMLMFDKNPAKAKAAVSTATDNLRDTVDDIRAALREERVMRGKAGIAEIEAVLSRFESEHPAIHTWIEKNGDMQSIPYLVWVCTNENLTESLTNLLKHSDADSFGVSIQVQNKLIKVRFKDNGTRSQGFKGGIGMQAMEERCAMCHGRCFFHSGEDGFAVVMTFTQLDRAQE